MDVILSRGMSITSGVATIEKDDSNLIGISIGGGSPLCPCLYVVQVFDNTASAREGTLESGDEIVGVNGTIVKGKSKVEVAKMIQASKVNIFGNGQGLQGLVISGFIRLIYCWPFTFGGSAQELMLLTAVKFTFNISV